MSILFGQSWDNLGQIWDRQRDRKIYDTVYGFFSWWNLLTIFVKFLQNTNLAYLFILTSEKCWLVQILAFKKKCPYLLCILTSFWMLRAPKSWLKYFLAVSIFLDDVCMGWWIPSLLLLLFRPQVKIILSLPQPTSWAISVN